MEGSFVGCGEPVVMLHSRLRVTSAQRLVQRLAMVQIVVDVARAQYVLGALIALAFLSKRDRICIIPFRVDS